MQEKKIEVTKKNEALQYIYFIGITLYFIYYWMHVSQIDQKYVPDFLLTAAIICFIIKIVFTKYNWMQIIIGVSILLLMFLCWKSSGSIDYPINALVLLGIKNIDIKKLMRLLFLVILLIVSVVMTWTLLHNMTGIVRIQDYGRGVVETRFQFGWWHPNRGHFIFFSMTAFFLYSYFRKCRWWIFACLMIFNYECFLLTKSRTGFAVTAMLILLFFLLKLVIEKSFQKILFIFLEFVNLFCIIFSMVGVGIIPISSDIYNQISRLTTGRFMLAQMFYKKFGVHIFGTSLGGQIPDLGIARTLIEYGVLVFILLYGSVLVASWILYKKNKLEIMLLLTVYMIYFTFEAYFQAAFDIKPIIIGYAFYQFSDVSFYRKTRRSVRKRGFD